MELVDLIRIVDAIRNEKPVSFNYRLQRGGKFNGFLNGFISWDIVYDFLTEILNSEPADFDNDKDKET